jgi:hypothetical protein
MTILKGLPLWEQRCIRRIDWRYRKGHQHVAVVVNDRDHLFPLLVFVPEIANTATLFFGHSVGAIAMEDAQIELVVLQQMPHIGDECMLKRAVICPPGRIL